MGEALIGAIYLDGGFEIVRNFIIKNWQELAKAIDNVPKDAKTVLQELTQSKAMGLPIYNLISKTGPSHEPEITIEVSLRNGLTAVAKASSKRQAEQIAANLLLEKL
jgi:ribonuclease III